MNESRRTSCRALCAGIFVIGVIALLMETRWAGEALERFTLSLRLDPLSVAGGAAVICAVAGFILLHFSERRGSAKHP
jgi:hypothetical protein